MAIVAEMRAEIRGRIELLQQFLGQPVSIDADFELLSMAEMQHRLSELQTTWTSKSKTS